MRNSKLFPSLKKDVKMIDYFLNAVSLKKGF
jgi:hypothetical protein